MATHLVYTEEVAVLQAALALADKQLKKGLKTYKSNVDKNQICLEIASYAVNEILQGLHYDLSESEKASWQLKMTAILVALVTRPTYQDSCPEGLLGLDHMLSGMPDVSTELFVDIMTQCELAMQFIQVLGLLPASDALDILSKVLDHVTMATHKTLVTSITHFCLLHNNTIFWDQGNNDTNRNVEAIESTFEKLFNIAFAKGGEVIDDNSRLCDNNTLHDENTDEVLLFASLNVTAVAMESRGIVTKELLQGKRQKCKRKMKENILAVFDKYGINTDLAQGVYLHVYEQLQKDYCQNSKFIPTITDNMRRTLADYANILIQRTDLKKSVSALFNVAVMFDDYGSSLTLPWEYVQSLAKVLKSCLGLGPAITPDTKSFSNTSVDISEFDTGNKIEDIETESLLNPEATEKLELGEGKDLSDDWHGKLKDCVKNVIDVTETYHTCSSFEIEEEKLAVAFVIVKERLQNWHATLQEMIPATIIKSDDKCNRLLISFLEDHVNLLCDIEGTILLVEMLDKMIQSFTPSDLLIRARKLVLVTFQSLTLKYQNAVLVKIIEEQELDTHTLFSVGQEYYGQLVVMFNKLTKTDKMPKEVAALALQSPEAVVTIATENAISNSAQIPLMTQILISMPVLSKKKKVPTATLR